MAQPVWLTPAGNLGTIPEGVFFQLPLLAEEPEFGDTVYFQVIAGQLPRGIQCEATGLIVGIPKAIASIQGVPYEVNADVTSKFAVRAYTKKTVNGVTVINHLADRTFTITVTGPNAPEWVTPSGNIGTYFDGSQITPYQLDYYDLDPTDEVIVKLVSGKLPNGLSLSSTGLISGYIGVVPSNTNVAGWSRDGTQPWSRFGWDFQTRSVNMVYEFVLALTDGAQSNLRAFTITVYSRNNLTADTIDITSDNTFVTADGTPVRVPLILTPEGSIGTTRSDNFYAFKFDGLDPSGNDFRYEVDVSGSYDLPPGVTLDPKTGWLYGYIPDLGLTELTYNFRVRVYQADELDVVSDWYNYSLGVIGSIDTDVTWVSPTDLGLIDTGSPSTFTIEAINSADIPLLYRLSSGSDSSLPQGLKLLPSGNIAGRVSFDVFMLDGNTTVFDVAHIGETLTPTTFDRTFTFTVNAYSENGLVSVFKTFNIQLDKVYDSPYQNLYIECMPPQNDRDVIDELLTNTNVIPDNLLYRADDPNFGKATDVKYWHAYGLAPDTYATYLSSLYQNHYWKNIVLGNIEIAQALDDLDNVIYEVVYSRVVDNLINDSGSSVSKDVVLPYPIDPGTLAEVDVVYPNSLINMRDQVIDVVGQISNILPRWMLSKQSNGRVLGFTPSWIIAYVEPGKGGQVAYNINEYFNSNPTKRLNLIDFEIDRYELDRLLSVNWDTETQQWNPEPSQVTFDQYSEYAYENVDLNTTGRVSLATEYNADGATTQYAFTNLATTDIIIVTVNDVIQTYGTDFTLTYIPESTVNFVTPPNTWQIEYLGDGTTSSFGFTPVSETLLTVYVGGVLLTKNVDYTVIGSDILLNVPATTLQSVKIQQQSVIVIYQIKDKYVDTTDSPVDTPTVFDGGSLRFIAPVDMYTDTTDFDKYLVFPKRTILG